MLQRAKSRGEETGRVVPTDLLHATYDQVNASVEKLAPLVDWVFEIENEAEPKIVRVRKTTDPGTDTGATKDIPMDWQQFKQVWRRQDNEVLLVTSCGEKKICP